MNKQLALRLIHPLCEGDEFASGVTLERIAIERDERDERKDAMRLVFSSGIDLVIARRSTNRAAFKTAHFSVSVQWSGDPDPTVSQPLLDRLRVLMTANDTTAPHRVVDAIGAPPSPDAPGAPDVDLWLIPGHIGNPLDLSIRTLRVLQATDLLLVEHGSTDVVMRLFEQFSLGAMPEVREIKQDPAWVTAVFEDARRNGLCVGLFGANEGAPGLCDPGWFVLRVVHELTPKRSIRSVAAGSALTTALMYSDNPRHRFEFMGMLENQDQESALLRSIGRFLPTGDPKTWIAFADGEGLRRSWGDLHRSTRALGGAVTLMANVSLDSEYVHRMAMRAVPLALPAFIAPEDKIVVRIDADGSVSAVSWLRRLMMKVRTLVR
ncbi:MAG: hypothetical protein VX944_02945 [Myxococcota bacterium]|nr:hypothetical protein [Myxococcota bacterium]